MDVARFQASLVSVLMFMFSLNPVIADDTLLQRATQLLDSGNANAAYALLEPVAATYAGNKDYDYLLGLTALESGQANLAVFALERAIATTPDFGGAHMELGRAYYALNELPTAKGEFETVLRLNPPTNVRQVAMQYIATINDSITKQNKQFNGYIEYSLGDDDNANSSTDEKYFGPWKLSANSVKTASPVESTTVALATSHKLAQNDKLLGSVSVYRQHFSDATFVDQQGINLSAGVTQTRQSFTTTFTLQSSIRRYENQDNDNEGVYFNADFRNQINNRSLVSYYVRMGELSYTHNQNQNMAQLVAGSQYLKIVNVSGDPVMLSTALSAGHDLAHSDSTTGAKDQIQFFETINAGFNKKAALIGRAFIGYFDYQSLFVNEELKGARRFDTQASFSLEVEVKPSKQWSISPQVSFTRNRSTIALYDYSRVKSAISVRYHF